MVVSVVIAVIVVLAVAGGLIAAAVRHPGSPRPAARPALASPPPASPPLVSWLSAAQLAGQRVIYSYPGLTPPPALLQLIRRGEAAGVIFFPANISSPAQLAAVARRLQQASRSPQNPVRTPLLLMTDQEGGVVRRLPGAPELSERQVGQSADPAAAAREAGASAAVTLRRAGLTVNLAPVLDVYRAAGGFIDQYGRSYSRDPGQVATLGAGFIQAEQSGGVPATAKHFPGLGSAARGQDTDRVPVTLNVPAVTLRRVDELPYQAAISAGVRLVMLSWAVYPALDPAHPAGLSRAVVQGQLRRRLGFPGVTITDALGAGALRAFGPVSRRGQLAALAGMDLLLCSGETVSQGEQARRGLQAGYQDGLLSRSSFQAAVRRVLALRASLPG